MQSDMTFRLKTRPDLFMCALRLRHTTKEISLVYLLWRKPQVLFLYTKDLDINAAVVLLLAGRIANGTFWRAQELTRAIGQVFNCNPPQFDGFLRY